MEHWADDERVIILSHLDDIGQPYSCIVWGNQGVAGIPPIIDDGTDRIIFNWFENSGAYPLVVFLDHNMAVFNMLDSEPSLVISNLIIGQMLSNLENDMAIEKGLLSVNNFKITSVYPNPFNPQINFEINISEPAEVSISILDINGRQVEQITQNELMTGDYLFSWDGSNQPSGEYFIRMSSKFGELIQKKIILIK